MRYHHLNILSAWSTFFIDWYVFRCASTSFVFSKHGLKWKRINKRCMYGKRDCDKKMLPIFLSAKIFAVDRGQSEIQFIVGSIFHHIYSPSPTQNYT